MENITARAIEWKFGFVADLYGDKIIDWRHPTVPQPTDEEIRLIVGEFEADRKRNIYQELRAREYPKIGDQLDAIWKLLATLTTGKEELPQEAVQVFDNVLAVKEKYPKS